MRLPVPDASQVEKLISAVISEGEIDSAKTDDTADAAGIAIVGKECLGLPGEFWEAEWRGISWVSS